MRTLPIYLYAAAALAQIQQAPPTPAGKGGIEGTVSDSVTQEPVKKVEVTLTGNIVPELTAVSDAGGHFAFRNLGPGNYWLNLSKPGYNPPQSILGLQERAGIVLGTDEQKKNVQVSITPGGTIDGRVVNEEGSAVRGCSVAAVQPAYELNRRTLRGAAGVSTNDKGEYRLHDLGAGRYYVFAHCQTELPAPHPLLARGDPRTPHETYLPQFYGGGIDPSTATKLTLAAGANLDGVDFRMSRVPAFTLQGSITAGDPEAFANGLGILLLPVNPLLRELTMSSAGMESQGHKFQINAVIPGSYLLVVHAGRLTAQRNVEVGAAPPDPVEIALGSESELKGSVQFDCDDHPPLEHGQVELVPLDGPLFTAQPQTQLDKDGAFTLTGGLSGRWRLNVSTSGYLKSVSLGGQQVSPVGFQIGAGAVGPLRIVMGCNLGQVDVNVTGALAGRAPSALLFPEDPDHMGGGLERFGAAAGNGQIEIGALPPGRYRVFATDIASPWPILQRPDWLKALESLTAAVEVPEGGHVSATVELIPREEVLRVLEEKE